MGRHERIAELTDLVVPEDGRTLEIADLATGYGRTARAILAAAKGPVRIHAVDTGPIIDDDLLHDARVRPVLADLDEPLPFADASLDRVTSVNVAEHLADPRAHVAECYRVLRPADCSCSCTATGTPRLVSSDDDALTRRLVDAFVIDAARVRPARRRLHGPQAPRASRAPHPSRSSPSTPGRTATAASTRTPSRGRSPAACWPPSRTTRNSRPRAAEWVQGLRRYADEGRFLFSVTDVVVVLRRPRG